MTFEQYIDSYLKKKFLEFKSEDGQRSPTEQDWEEMKPEAKKFMQDMFCELPLLKEIMITYDKQAYFSEILFARDIKLIIKKHLK